MLPVDNATAAPEGQVVVAPTGKPLDTQVSTDSPNLPADKYAGKTLEEVIEMHKNAEKAFTEKAMEIAELKKAPKEEVTPVQIDDKLFLEATRLQTSAKGTIVPLESHPKNAIKSGIFEVKSLFASFLQKRSGGRGKAPHKLLNYLNIFTRASTGRNVFSSG